MTHRNLSPWLAAGGLAAALLISPGDAAAQSPAPSAAAAAPASVAGAADRTVSLNLRDTPLRTALQMLFEGSGQQHAVENSVPNVPITLQIRDIPFQTALRTIVRLAGVTFQKEGEIFIVRLRQPAPELTASIVEPSAPTEALAGARDEVVEKIPINYLHPAVVAYLVGAQLILTEDQVQPGFGGGAYGGLGGASGYGAGNGSGFYGNAGGAGLGISGSLGFLGNQGGLNQGFGNFGNQGGSPGINGNYGQGTGLGINPTGNSLIIGPRFRR